MGSTLEFKVNERLASFSQRRKEDVGATIAEDEAEYLLDLALILKAEHVDADDDESPPQQGTIDAFSGPQLGKKTASKQNMLRSYLARVEKDQGALQELLDEYHKQQWRSWMCEICDLPLTSMAREAALVCMQCGQSTPNPLECDVTNLNYSDTVDMIRVSKISYKCQSHFADLLNNLQARGGSTIPESIIIGVREELAKDRITDRSKITVARVKGYLKQLGRSDLYEQSGVIINTISGIPPLMLDADVETALKRDFLLVEGAFVKLEEKTGRSNLPSYQYVLYQLARLRGLDKLASRCTLLKSRAKLHLLDKIWKEICLINGWTFLRTI